MSTYTIETNEEELARGFGKYRFQTRDGKSVMWVHEPYQICPGCQHPAIRTMTTYGIRDDCKECKLTSWDGKDLVSQDVMKLRKELHILFDKLWKGKDSDKRFPNVTEARAWLANAMEANDIDKKYLSHFGLMDKEECEKARGLIQKLLHV